jgi:hypothetical protein
MPAKVISFQRVYLKKFELKIDSHILKWLAKCVIKTSGMYWEVMRKGMGVDKTLKISLHSIHYR